MSLVRNTSLKGKRANSPCLLFGQRSAKQHAPESGKVLNCTNPSADWEPCTIAVIIVGLLWKMHPSIYLSWMQHQIILLKTSEELVEQVRYQPQAGKYKIYIVDEVHMLSTQAFNAFLKTLEEPPPYAKFILATTEKHKIIPTILSRCQIYDFRRIQEKTSYFSLKKFTKESIQAEEEALHLIAQKQMVHCRMHCPYLTD